MSDYIIGKRALIEALKARVPIEEVLLSKSNDKDDLLDEICNLCHSGGVPIKKVDKGDIEKALGSDSRASRHGRAIRFDKNAHQGIVARVAEYKYCPFEEIVGIANDYADSNGGRALVVIVDHITDGGNFGAILRSAESVGASGVVIANKRSVEVSAATYKTSAGAINYTKIAKVPNIAASIDKLKDNGFWIVGATEKGDDLVWQSDFKGKIGLVLGNENEGISQLVRKHCDFEVYLPQVGEIASLNVAQAATVFMYEWLRQNF